MRSEVSVIASDSAKIRQQRNLATLETRSIEGENQSLSALATEPLVCTGPQMLGISD